MKSGAACALVFALGSVSPGGQSASAALPQALEASAGNHIVYSVNWFGDPDGARQYDLFSGSCAVFRIVYLYYQMPHSYQAISYVARGTILWIDTPHYGDADGGGLRGSPKGLGVNAPGPHQAGVYTNIGWPDPKFLTALSASCAPPSDASKSLI